MSDTTSKVPKLASSSDDHAPNKENSENVEKMRPSKTGVIVCRYGQGVGKYQNARTEQGLLFSRFWDSKDDLLSTFITFPTVSVAEGRGFVTRRG